MQFLYNYSRKNTDEIITNVGTHDTSETRLMTVRNQSKGTQTDYRDSETQTISWEPPYKLTLDSKSEVLGLTGLQWDDTLPIGMHEVKIVKRMRIKNAWESILPPLNSKVNVQAHNAIITMIDEEERASRDKELQLLIDSRMNWINEMMKMNDVQRKKKVIERLEKIGKYLNQLRNKEISQIKRDLSRELRKLNSKYRSNNSKFAIDGIINKKTPEFKKDLKVFKTKTFYDTQIVDKKPVPIDIHLTQSTQIKMIKLSEKSEEFCVRETRWTEEKLRKLHTDLRNIRLNVISEKANPLKRQRQVNTCSSAQF